MLQPDSHGTPSSWGEKSSSEKSSAEKSPGQKTGEKKLFRAVGDVVSSQDPRDVAEVARALAAHGGGAASFDLALDLVLHQVVEEARFATGATGAAIALARAGEMVCRATSGRDAPDLGVRLETTSGLSGACLQTGMIQQCGDTETDLRVNAEACRRLGVRSILVLPLRDGPEPFGVLEVFSSLSNAFGDREISELQILARRVVAHKRSADTVGAAAAVVPGEVLPESEEKPASPAIEIKTSPERQASAEPEPMADSAAELSADARPVRSNDIWTPVLGILVIVTAVLLGLALGWRGAIVRGVSGGVKSALKRGSSASSATAPSGGLAEPAQSGSPQPGALPGGASQTGASQGGTTGAATSIEPPTGGLVVTQNGKVIYRLPAAERVGIATSAGGVAKSQATRDAEGSASRLIPSRSIESGLIESSLIESRLIHRVEPQYPAEALVQKIQGLVTLDVQIGGEGAVHNIDVVEGNPVLAQAAVEAVTQWRYQPYAVDGRPVEMQTRITIRFTLPPS
jgi:TonB family protein